MGMEVRKYCWDFMVRVSTNCQDLLGVYKMPVSITVLCPLQVLQDWFELHSIVQLHLLTAEPRRRGVTVVSQLRLCIVNKMAKFCFLVHRIRIL